MSRLHTDDRLLVDNSTDAVVFRITNTPAQLTASQVGVLRSWDGAAFQGTRATIVGTNLIEAPGLYEINLGVAGNAAVQEPIKP